MKSSSLTKQLYKIDSGAPVKSGGMQMVDNRPAAVIQKKRAESLANKIPEAAIQKKENATGLPDNLKSGIENLSGHSMDDVKVHYNSSQPAQLNAHAYAQGTNIHIASGQEKHLAHEAWHVVQQKQGRVKPTMQMKGKVNVNDDAGLEKEADVMGNEALQMKSFDGYIPTASSCNTSVIQRYLIVGNTDYTRGYYNLCHTHDAAADKNRLIADGLNAEITAIAQLMLGELSEGVLIEKKARDEIKADAGGLLRRQIGKWIEDQVGAKGAASRNADFGRKNQPRVYTNYKQLAFALTGWVNAKPARKAEKALATRVQASDPISQHLNSILLRINAWINGHATLSAEMLADLGMPAQINGHSWNVYQSYFAAQGVGKALPANIVTVLTNPQNYDVRQKTGILHDLMHYFLEKIQHKPAANLLRNGPGDGVLEATVPDGPGRTKREGGYTRPRNSQIRRKADARMVGGADKGGGLVAAADMGGLVASDEEVHGTYEVARSKNLPMYGRHSYTAARLMKMVENVGGTPTEISAIAWSIMAYWRKNYDHTSIPYHTLHEIMDFAPNYGVAYNPDNPHAGIDLFTTAGLILSLRSTIPINPNSTDINKLITEDTAGNNVIWFLSQYALWANATVLAFLQANGKAALIAALKVRILAAPIQGDIDNLIATETVGNNVIWFLSQHALWANATVLAFLRANGRVALIADLKVRILATQSQGDIDKLIATDTAVHNADWFLWKTQLWGNAIVFNFLKNTALPLDEFRTLQKGELQVFFKHNEETKRIYTVIGPDKQAHVGAI